MADDGRPLARIVVGSERGDPLEVVGDLQFLVLEHPVAAQAAFAALVAEGRRFAATDEGRRWKERLSRSELVRRARVVWETATLEQLGDAPVRHLPSSYLDAVVRLAADPALERLLSELFTEDLRR